MRNLAPVGILLVILAILAAACGGSPDPSPRTGSSDKPVADWTQRVVAGPVDPDSRIGAIFLGGGDLHTCTGSVLQSAGSDLMLTAAHCLSGDIKSTTFVPGFAGKAAPGKVWRVGTIYFDPRWIAANDPHADFAIARLTQPDGGPGDQHLGPGLSLGAAPAPGSRISVMGYPAGVGGMPIGCQASTGVTANGYPFLPCTGLVDGTSGAPWIMGSTVTGVIGGLDAGGCEEKISYSAPLDEHIIQLLARAEAGGPGDTAPVGMDTEC